MKKNLKIIGLFIIIDVLIIGGWILYMNPDASMAIILMYLAPILFLLNMITAAIMYFIRRRYSMFFLFNAFVSLLIMSIFFTWVTKKNTKTVLEGWEFAIGDTCYYLTKYNENNTYRITYSTESGSVMGNSNDRGIMYQSHDTIYFIDQDSNQYYIYNGYIYNFKNTNTIKVKKAY